MEKTAYDIVKLLQDKGYTAYWAGGCVRDFLLGEEPKDYDIVTSAKPEEIEDILEKTIPIGKEFGVMLAVVNGHHFEIATFRSDSGYSDGRRPDAVLFTDPQEDAFRRDFTINGMFYDPITKEVHDFVGGQDDIKNRLIRFIGEPKERIHEDHLRIMRAIRFKNTIEFQYHPDTYHAIEEFAGLAANVSQERLRDEINKMLVHKNRVAAFRDLAQTGVLKDVLPEVEEMIGVAQPYEMHMEGDVFEHTMKCIDSFEDTPSIPLAWAVLLHDVGKPQTFEVKERIRFDRHSQVSADIAQNIMHRLKFPSKDIKHVCWLIEHHFMIVQLLEMPEGRKRHWFLNEWFTDLLALFRADALGQLPLDLSLYHKIRDVYEEYMRNMPKKPPKLISGKEVMETLGLKPGEKVGEILDELYHLQLEEKITTKEEATSWLEGKKE